MYEIFFCKYFTDIPYVTNATMEEIWRGQVERRDHLNKNPETSLHLNIILIIMFTFAVSIIIYLFILTI